jgi:hypothetical protein
MSSFKISEEISLYLRARVPLIVLVTVEEQRAIATLDEVRRGRDPDSDLVTWDVAERFRSKAGRKMPEAGDPVGALDKISEQATSAPDRRDLYVLKDFHEFYSKDARVRRKLRSLAQQLMFTGSSLIVTTPVRALPPKLRDETVRVEMPLPDEAALRAELDGLISSSGIRVSLPEQGRARLAQAALGLTITQAKRAFAKAIVRDRGLDDRAIDAVLEEKKAVIRESQALEFYPAEQTPDDVGGLDQLKSWLTLRERAFSEEAAAFGLPAPRGLALIGIPGTGKSLTAKMIGGLWRMPPAVSPLRVRPAREVQRGRPPHAPALRSRRRGDPGHRARRPGWARLRCRADRVRSGWRADGTQPWA